MTHTSGALYQIRPMGSYESRPARTFVLDEITDIRQVGKVGTWVADFASEEDAKTVIAAFKLIDQMSRMTDPSDLRNSTDPCDDAVETLSSLCLRARGILGLPEEFDHANATCENCGLPVDSDDAFADVCSCEEDEDDDGPPCGHSICGETLCTADANHRRDYLETEFDRAMKNHTCEAEGDVQFCARCGAELTENGTCENDHARELDLYCPSCGERIFEENPPDGEFGGVAS